ncbi:hypothetical protein GCM10023339_57730 [Alloalcanivorax gelatiniphagus]
MISPAKLGTTGEFGNLIYEIFDTLRTTLNEPSPEVNPAIQDLFNCLGIETEGRVEGIMLGNSLANSGLHPLFKEARP